MTSTTIADVNRMMPAEFVARFGGVFEHSPWIAERAYAGRPFASVAALHGAMVAAVMTADRSEQLGLLNAHPELAGKEAASGTLTRDSTAEQKSVGLNSLSRDEMAAVRDWNARYRTRFGFPFIIAVRQHTKHSIFAEFERRLANDPATELRTALDQVFTIVRLRLDGLVSA